MDLNYGLFTDSTYVSEHILIDEEAFIYVWEETLVESDIRPYEGEGVLSWKVMEKAGLEQVLCQSSLLIYLRLVI